MTSCAPLWAMEMDYRAADRALAEVFQKRLRWLMEEAGLDPAKGEHLARKVGVSKGTGYNWLTPGRRPSARALTLIARAFNTTTDYLLGLSDDPHPAATVADVRAAATEIDEASSRAGTACPHQPQGNGR